MIKCFWMVVINDLCWRVWINYWGIKKFFKSLVNILVIDFDILIKLCKILNMIVIG